MKIFFGSLLIFVLVSFLSACTNDFPEPERIRPFFGLIASDIPYAENMDRSIHQNPDICGSCLNENKMYVDFCYSWDNPSDSSYINVTISITESSEDANLVLIEKSKLNNFDWCDYLENAVLKVDEVAVAGTKSLGNGQLFMRDNIVVLIKAGFRYCNWDVKLTPDYSIPEIAEAIDRKIKKSKTYPSASDLKPVIKDIVFEKYPIPYAEEIQVDLLVEPVGSVLLCEFGFPPSRFYASTLTSGYLWLDTMSKIQKNEHELCVFVVSKEGFCADSTFIIQIEPWD